MPVADLVGFQIQISRCPIGSGNPQHFKLPPGPKQQDLFMNDDSDEILINFSTQDIHTPFLKDSVNA